MDLSVAMKITKNRNGLAYRESWKPGLGVMYDEIPEDDIKRFVFVDNDLKVLGIMSLGVEDYIADDWDVVPEINTYNLSLGSYKAKASFSLITRKWEVDVTEGVRDCDKVHFTYFPLDDNIEYNVKDRQFEFAFKNVVMTYQEILRGIKEKGKEDSVCVEINHPTSVLYKTINLNGGK